MVIHNPTPEDIFEISLHTELPMQMSKLWIPRYTCIRFPTGIFCHRLLNTITPWTIAIKDIDL